MIARLTGILQEVNLTQCIIDVNGVGYLVAIPLSTFDRLPRAGEAVTLRINTQVREDAINLYGFSTAEEKELFEVLINTTGVGPKLALSILSSMPVNAFCSAVINADLKTISRISGIGKRTAERLVVELKDKLSKIMPSFAANSSDVVMPDDKAAAAEDATLALEQLGFKRENVSKILRKIVEELPVEECSSENLIRRALQALNT